MQCKRFIKISWGLLSVACILQCCDGSENGHGTENVDNSAHLDLRVEGDGIYAEEVWPGSGAIDGSGEVTEKCMKLLEAFTNATTFFLTCAMTNARPLHYCENCVGEFGAVNKAYDLIANDDIQNGSTCQDELLRADNVQVVLLAYDFVQDVWDKSTCHNCYYVEEKNDTTVYHATKETVEMLKKIEDTQGCFHDFGEEGEPLNLSVCSACIKFYAQANVYYNDLDEENKLCSDLKDSMNYTRRMWSSVFHCTIARRNDVLIYVIAVCVGSLPLILYLGVWVFTSHQEKRTRRRERSRGSPEMRTPLNEPPGPVTEM